MEDIKLKLSRNLSVAASKLFIAHSGIAGMTGSGKSREVSATLLAQCIEKQPVSPEDVKYAFLVVDTQSEYFRFMDEYPKHVIVFSPDATKGVPFRLSSRNISVDDIATFLREVTKKEITKPELAAIYLAIDELRSKGDYVLEQVYTKLYEFEAYSLLPAFEKIMATGIFGPQETPLSLLIRPGEASILDLGGLMPEIQAIIVAHLNRRLWQARINKEIAPLVEILEEASIFAPEEKKAPSSEILYTIATQGRGYHFLLISIFQRSSLTSKNILSQTHNWIIGKTGNPHDRKAILTSVEKIETEHDQVIKNLELAKEFLVTGFVVENPIVINIPDPKLLAAKGGRIPAKQIESTFKREDLGPYIESIQRIEQQEQTRVQETINRIRLAREQEIKGVPTKEFEKVKSSLEREKKRYQEAIERADKRAREKYEAKIKELEAEVERLTKLVTLKGAPVSDILEAPIVKKRLEEKLTEQQRSLVIFLERTGPSNPEKIAAYLGCAPKTVTGYVSDVNKAIPDLVVMKGGAYQSRLRLIFPVTEAAKAEVKEIEELRAQVRQRDVKIHQLETELTILAGTRGSTERALKAENERFLAANKALTEATVKIGQLEAQLKEVGSRVQIPPTGPGVARATGPLVSLDENRIREIVKEEIDKISPSGVVDVTLRKTLGEFNVSINKEKFPVDESSWIGKILARGVAGFFEDRKDFGQIMNELERVYSASKTSGGTREAVQKALDDLCAKGILDREQRLGGPYQATAEFKERVGKKT